MYSIYIAWDSKVVIYYWEVINYIYHQYYFSLDLPWLTGVWLLVQGVTTVMWYPFVHWAMTPCPGGDNSYVVSICALGYYMVFGVSCWVHPRNQVAGNKGETLVVDTKLYWFLIPFTHHSMGYAGAHAMQGTRCTYNSQSNTWYTYLHKTVGTCRYFDNMDRPVDSYADTLKWYKH